MSDYAFLTRWRVEGTASEVSAVIGDAEGLPRWWPSVYLDVQVIERGEPNGVGKLVSLYTKGFLPYTLRWRFRVIETREPRGFTIAAEGDFVGTGVWTFTPDGPRVDVVYDWRIRAQKPLLRVMTPVLRPIFSANHHWAMARGEESLRLELLRRRARTPEEAARAPAPPSPTWPHHPRAG